MMYETFLNDNVIPHLLFLYSTPYTFFKSHCSRLTMIMVQLN